MSDMKTECSEISGRQVEDSASASEFNTSDGDPPCNNKYKLTDELKKRLTDMPEVLDFIMLLQKYIEKQKRALNKVKRKLKKSKTSKHVACQTEPEVPFERKPAEVPCETQEAKSLADEIKEAAEQAIQSSGFVYEETSGMYYDYNTGYYYNAEYGLYYDGNSGTYMTYNQDTQQYEFHSQVTVPGPECSKTQHGIVDKTKSKRKKTTRENDTKAHKRKCVDQTTDGKEGESDLEEGECSFSSSDESVDCAEEPEESANSDDSDISKQWPPCMRIIIEETSVSNLKTGTLYIITFEGGTLGREGHHSILLSDVNVSKHHLKFSFDKDGGKYMITDLGSRNGTLLNGKRMAPSKQESEPTEIVHGSKIQVGGTVLLCHIHDGNQTCGHCEPGLIQTTVEEKESHVSKRITRATKSEKHKNELKNLRRRFGVGNYEEDPSKLATGYTDRAQKRRDTVGSQNPHEKTQVASIDESIPKENKGFKLLSKMGWKEGQSLGKEGQGIAEPVKLVSNPGSAGVGCSVVVPEIASCDAGRQKIWKKTQDRYEKLPEKNSAFEEEETD